MVQYMQMKNWVEHTKLNYCDERRSAIRDNSAPSTTQDSHHHHPSSTRQTWLLPVTKLSSVHSTNSTPCRETILHQRSSVAIRSALLAAEQGERWMYMVKRCLVFLVCGESLWSVRFEGGKRLDSTRIGREGDWWTEYIGISMINLCDLVFMSIIAFCIPSSAQ